MEHHPSCESDWQKPTKNGTELKAGEHLGDRE
jgi:hypothetical protein